jgi:hypothetical protein
MFKTTIQTNGEIKDEDIVHMSIFTLHDTILKYNQNFLAKCSNYNFTKLEQTFYNWFKYMINNEQVYMQLKMFKQDHMEKMEVYYEHLMKLTNNLQKKTTNSILTTMLKFDLQPYLRITKIRCKGIKRKHKIQG